MLCLPSTWSTALNDIWRVRLDWDKREAVRSLMFRHTQNILPFLCTQHVCMGEWCGHGGWKQPFHKVKRRTDEKHGLALQSRFSSDSRHEYAITAQKTQEETYRASDTAIWKNSFSPLPNSINAQCIISPWFTAWCNGMNVESDWLLFLTCLLC